MRVMEFDGRAGKGLALVLTPESEEALEQTLPEIEQVVRAWRGRHGDACRQVTLSVVCGEGLHGAVEARFGAGGGDLSPLLEALDVKLVLLDAHGRTVKEVDHPRRPTARPWWRFW